MGKSNNLGDGNYLNNRIIFLYTFAYAYISFVFLFFINSSIVNRFFQLDLWWLIPSALYYTQGKSFGGILKFIFGTEPFMLGTPPVKSFLYFVTNFFTLQPKNFIYIQLIFHFLNSALLFFLAKRLKLGVRIGFFSSLMYISLYAHSEAYTWPFNMQHILVTFFILLVLNLYLKTDELLSSARNGHYRYWILTILVNFIASFSRTSIFILPAIILAHILFCSKDNNERIRKYDVWSPFFVTYLVYPMIVLTSIGEGRLGISLKSKYLPFLLNWLIFFFGGILCLIIFRFCIKNYPKYWSYKFKRSILLIIVSLGIWGITIIRDSRNLILPYNIMLPFLATMNSFFHPLEDVLLLDSTRHYHLIHSQLSIFGFLLGIIFIIVFVRNFLFKNNHLLILFIWYLIPFPNLNSYSNILSRYIVYISPLVCLIVASVLLCVYDYIVEKIKSTRLLKEITLVSAFTLIMLPNIIAIKLVLFKQKMATTFYLYDYIRAANIIKQDILENKESLKGRHNSVTINNAEPMPIKELWPPSLVSSENFYNFQFVLFRVLNNLKVDKFIINPKFQDTNDSINYFLHKEKIINPQGKNIDSFSKWFNEGINEFKNRKYSLAASLFERAVKLRPFFINYILSDYQLEDSIWITGSKDINSWLDKMLVDVTLRVKTEKALYIKSIIKNENFTYMQALFYLSYLNYVLQDIENSQYWFSKIQYLVSDPAQVAYMLSQVSEIKSDDNAMTFLKKFTDPMSFPYLWYRPPRNRVPTHFQLFILKFIFDGKINRVIDNRFYRYRFYRYRPQSFKETPE